MADTQGVLIQWEFSEPDMFSHIWLWEKAHALYSNLAQETACEITQSSPLWKNILVYALQNRTNID